MGRDAAEDGGQGSACRRGPRPAGGLHRQAVEGCRPRLNGDRADHLAARVSSTCAATPEKRSSRRTSCAMTATALPAKRRRKAQLLPYVLSLPALLVCIGILVPF